MDISPANEGAGGSALANAAKREAKRKALAWLLSNPVGWFIILGVGIAILLVSFVFIAGGVRAQQQCSVTVTASGGTATQEAKNSIPADWMPVLRAAEQQYGVPWNVDAGVAKVESNFGLSTLPGVHSGANSAGASGPMQIGTGGAAGNTWGKYGVDGDGDGKKDVYNVADAVFGAANYLHASGAPGDLHKAILAYNHAEWYYQEVMGYATSYAKGDFSVSQSASTTTGCASTLGGDANPDAKALANNPNINWLHAGPERSDLYAGRVSPRLIALLSQIAAAHKIGIFALVSDHHPGTNHESGRAADIAIVDGEVCNALAHGRSGKCWELAQELDRLQGCLHPTELIYYYDPGPSPDSFARADHSDHVHVGYDGPLGPKQYSPGTSPCSQEAIDGTG